MAANMELMPAPDIFESIDFNFLTTEIFQTHEHEFDYTLTDGEKMHLEWHTSDNDDVADDVFEVEAADNEQNLLECDANKQQECDDDVDDRTGEDEPKVEAQ